MKQRLMQMAAAAVLAGGMAMAQTAAPAPTPQAAAGQAQAKPRVALRRHMMQALNLTGAQKQQAKAIFQQARQDSQPVAQQLRQNREALAAAVKANDTAQIQQLATQQGTLRGQELAIRSGAMAKFYSTLTPEQRAKADQMQQRMQPPGFLLCAEHVRQLGGESPLDNLMEVKS